MPWHTPERKTEQALKRYFETVLGFELEGVQLATRFSNVKLTEPRVDIVARGVEPEIELGEYQTGNWVVAVMLRVVSHYERDVDAENHDEILGNIVDKLIMITDDEPRQDATADEINKTLDENYLTVRQVDVMGRTTETAEQQIITEQAVEITIIPS